LAVVGSRNATRYGLATTHKLCADLASLGFTIVSGMARGIDTAAHEGALMGSGRTVAVLGSGLANIYPAENRKLAQQIADSGAVIQNFPAGRSRCPSLSRTQSGHQRDGLRDGYRGSDRRSGSLITARLAADQGGGFCRTRQHPVL
jgi:DNA processing protein